MDSHRTFLASLSHFVHRQFIWLVVGSYAIAGIFPAFGLWIRGVSLGEITLFGERTNLSLPVLMLALLLLNAGLGVQTAQLRHLLRSPGPLLLGLAANLLIPVAFIFAMTRGMWLWHNPDEVQNLLVGLALVASMPIAGSSTAWAQNANGDLALSLGLVLGSTLLSPLTTPLALHAAGLMATGDYAEDLHELAAGGTGAFLGVVVILPSLLGVLGHAVLGWARVARAKPLLKLFNSLNLLLLNYANASVSLPESVADPDWDFLAVIVGAVAGMCVLAFASGWLTGRVLGAGPAQRVSLMFGLGMNNNGTGLVLAAMALADHPRVLLPIIFYNLVQHLVAGAVDFALSRAPAYQASG
jgi:BASS family bile acid:Na+ symporter